MSHTHGHPLFLEILPVSPLPFLSTYDVQKLVRATVNFPHGGTYFVSWYLDVDVNAVDLFSAETISVVTICCKPYYKLILDIIM